MPPPGATEPPVWAFAIDAPPVSVSMHAMAPIRFLYDFDFKKPTSSFVAFGVSCRARAERSRYAAVAAIRPISGSPDLRFVTTETRLKRAGD